MMWSWLADICNLAVGIFSTERSPPELHHNDTGAEDSSAIPRSPKTAVDRLALGAKDRAVLMAIRQVEPDWAGKLFGFTLLFEALVVALCREMPFAAVARVVNLSWHRVAAICKRYVDLALDQADFSEVNSATKRTDAETNTQTRRSGGKYCSSRGVEILAEEKDEILPASVVTKVLDLNKYPKPTHPA